MIKIHTIHIYAKRMLNLWLDPTLIEADLKTSDKGISINPHNPMDLDS